MERLHHTGPNARCKVFVGDIIRILHNHLSATSMFRIGEIFTKPGNLFISYYSSMVPTYHELNLARALLADVPGSATLVAVFGAGRGAVLHYVPNLGRQKVA